MHAGNISTNLESMVRLGNVNNSTGPAPLEAGLGAITSRRYAIYDSIVTSPWGALYVAHLGVAWRGEKKQKSLKLLSAFRSVYIEGLRPERPPDPNYPNYTRTIPTRLFGI